MSWDDDVWTPDGDKELSKALFGKRQFIDVVQAVDRLSKGDDWFTRRNVQQLLYWYGSSVKELQTLTQIGVLHEVLYDKFEYRYFLLGGQVWDGLKTIAGITDE